jgi:hypothetical protein
MPVPFLAPKRTNKGRVLKKDADNRNVYWTLDRIKIGVEKFMTENKKYPSATDFNLTPTLPTSRHINMYFGGMNDLRLLLNIDNTYNPHKGIYRSNTMIEVNKRSLEAEQRIYNILCKKFGEVCVHSEKKFILDNELNPCQKTVHVDFYVYNKTENFSVDIFCCKDVFSFISHVRLKIKKYFFLPSKIFLVVANSLATNEDLEAAIKGAVKDGKPSHITITTETDFPVLIKNYLALPI